MDETPALAGGSKSSVGDKAIVGVLTISDRASAGVYKDIGGPAVLSNLAKVLESEWEAVYRVVADEQPEIEAAIIEMADKQHCCLVITTGGTGPSPRDVTPEATAAVCTRMLPGFGEQMRALGLKHVPTAVLSRQTAGIRGTSLVINFPGKPTSIAETFEEVFQSIPYCVQLIGGPYLQLLPGVKHPAFRPKDGIRTSAAI